MIKKNGIIAVLVAVITALLLYIYLTQIKKPTIKPDRMPELPPMSLAAEESLPNMPQPPTYTPVSFDLIGRLKGFDRKQIEEHEQLYKGYVAKRNLIAQKLLTADRSLANNNTTYSPFRSLKIAQTFARNGDILHRLYFQNMGGAGTKVGKQMEQLIKESFGTLQNFKEDLFATAKASRGWAVTAYNLDDGRISNYLLEAHNQTVPVMVVPILVLDVYEHAYMIQWGIKRIPYLDAFWQNLDWNVIEERIDKLVNLFRK